MPDPVFTAPAAAVLEKIFRDARTIAVVGLSPKPDRPSFGVASYLQKQGYRIIPVNPAVPEVLGEKSYPNLLTVPDSIDVVGVFRQPEHVPSVVEESIAVGARVLWLQDGVVHDEAARRAAAAGMTVVMDRCMMRDHRAFAAPAP